MARAAAAPGAVAGGDRHDRDRDYPQRRARGVRRARAQRRVGARARFSGPRDRLGKVLLAQLDGQQLDALIAEFGLEPWTERTITDRDALLVELARIRERGHALEDEEYDTGLRSIAAPVREHTGQVVAALGILGPLDRLTDERIARLTDAVTTAAGAFSRSLGAGQEGLLGLRRPSVEVSAVVEHTPPLGPRTGAAPQGEDSPAPGRRRRPPARGRTRS